MALDDGSADRQADAHAAGLGRVEGLEEGVHPLLVEPYSDILHTQVHVIAFASAGPDHDASGAIVDTVHRL
jgi:hypothetical protein